MRSNASTFRSFLRIEDEVMRAAMPKTAALDPKPLRGYPTTVKASAPKPLAPLTASLASVLAAKAVTK